MKAVGNVHKYDANVDTDVILPARYIVLSAPEELAAHCMEDIDANFVHNVKQSDFIVADVNFGCGSSREHAPIAIKAAGIACVIAKSFARIFYRNAINTGLNILECPDTDQIATSDKLEVDFASGEIANLSKGEVYHSRPFPHFIQEIIEAGGLLNLLKTK